MINDHSIRHGSMPICFNLFLTILLVYAFSLTNVTPLQAQGGDDSDVTWHWRRSGDPVNVKRSRAELDSLVKLHEAYVANDSLGIRLNLSGAHLENANLKGANLTGATLNKSNLKGANLNGATLKSFRCDSCNLTGADMARATLYGVRLEGAILDSTNLSGATFDAYSELKGASIVGANLSRMKIYRTNLTEVNLEGSRLDSTDFIETALTRANLANSSLVNATFDNVELSGTVMTNSDLTDVSPSRLMPPQGAMFHLTSPPIDLRTIELRVGNPFPLELLQLLKDKGFKQAERDVICAINRADANWFQKLLFDYTTEYGSNLYRPWILFCWLYLGCALFYYVFTLIETKSGLMLEFPIYTNEPPENLRGHLDFSPESSGETKVWQGNIDLTNYTKQGYNWIPTKIRMIWWALFFSGISAFNIGFRDVSFGRWLSHLTRTPLDLTAFGWVRVISGIQALVSVYLLALWVLSFVGTPFR